MLNILHTHIRETVSASRFLQLVKKNPQVVNHVNFVAPKIGRKNDFGKFVVEYNYGRKR